MTGKKVGIREIAEAAGVAMSTVSHVLNGTASISDEVRDRVLEVAKSLGYLARRQAKGAIATITKVMLAAPEDALPHNDLNLVSWTILSSLSRECDARGIHVTPFALHSKVGPSDLVAAAREAGVDGLVLLNDDDEALLSAVASSGMPAVLINGEDPNMLIDSVTPGNRFAAQKATRRLITRGHRDIRHLTFAGRKTMRRRQDGFLDALEEAGIEAAPDGVLVARSFEPACGEERIARWLSQENGPGTATALFCAADNLAFGAIRALRAAGYRVPEDISVIGFDGVALGEFHDPPLTTVAVPMDQFAAEALSLLQQRILAGRGQRAARRVELGCNVIERASVRDAHAVKNDAV
ncbi:LacI family DNA-binding transcriptional regulator [Roseibium sp. Sym1]|uniref:LacI family DNA-binding transcriptional regulator n=1 Tax=Roseibium sp. Sym1 TaxID=3016006 RepID=UPI0022B5D382|nr:LacI family DNA-binding transcriptional regulator [Roseibium sp. Sym1]